MRELINVYPFFADNFLTQGVWELPAAGLLDESVEAIPFEYPNTLQSTYSHLTKIDKIQLDKGFDLSVYCLSDGIFCFVAKSFLKNP